MYTSYTFYKIYFKTRLDKRVEDLFKSFYVNVNTRA